MMDQQQGLIGIETELLDRLLEMHARMVGGSNGNGSEYWLLYDRVLKLMRRRGRSSRIVTMWLGLMVAWSVGSFALGFGWLVGLAVGR